MQPQCQCSELMFCIGFLGASIVRVANELGRGNAKALKFSIKTIMSTSVCIGMTFFVLCLVFWHQIAHLFTSTEQVVQVASTLSTFLAISMLFNSIQIVLGGIAIGAGFQSLVAMVNMGCYYGVRVPVGAVLGFVLNLQVMGLWIGLFSGVVLQTLILVIIVWRTNWDEQVKKASERLSR
ncbi:protein DETOXIFICATION 24-like isoform X1 [Hibiscus syriacus]|uniref:protein DETOXIFICATION 24-like isoform X1 n=1 Tax=Hibiscus syriacus TaxID=106335 RepID=UPI001923D6F5|nr:protein DETOXIFICATION 24-like isoform X1 [Hibiscus syriacus]